MTRDTVTVLAVLAGTIAIIARMFERWRAKEKRLEHVLVTNYRAVMWDIEGRIIAAAAAAGGSYPYRELGAPAILNEQQFTAFIGNYQTRMPKGWRPELRVFVGCEFDKTAPALLLGDDRAPIGTYHKTHPADVGPEGQPGDATTASFLGTVITAIRRRLGAGFYILAVWDMVPVAATVIELGGISPWSMDVREPRRRGNNCLKCSAPIGFHVQGRCPFVDQPPTYAPAETLKLSHTLALPEGVTCRDCAHFDLCEVAYGQLGADELCHFDPVRFSPAKKPNGKETGQAASA